MASFAAEQHTKTPPKKGSSKGIVGLLSETYTKWSDHQAPRLGASVAFYSILSFAPLLLLITAIISLVFGHEHAQGALIGEARQVIGDRGADTVQTLLKNAEKPASGAIASAIAFITLLFGASGVFAELQDALNLMWEVKPQSGSGVMGMIKQRLFSFGMVLSIGFLLLISLVLSAGLAFVGHAFGQLVPMPPFLLEIINFIVSFVVISGLFTLMFKYVPNAKVSWKNACIGAVGTALLFTIGKFLLGIYLGKASVGSTYGAAGSLVAVVVWIYYSAQIFFFGAEFTHVYSEREQPKDGKTVAEAQPPAEQAHSTFAARAGSGAGGGTGIAPARQFDGAISAALMPSPTPPLSGPALAAPNSKPAMVNQPTAQPVAPIESVVVEPPATHSIPTSVTFRRHRTKPELVTSMAVGFLLGRLSGRLNKNHRATGD